MTARLAYGLLKRNASPLQSPTKFLIGPKGNAVAEWGKKYNSVVSPSMIPSDSCLKLGDIVIHATASEFGMHVVTINSLKMAEEIFEQRAQLYSDRPMIPIVEV